MNYTLKMKDRNMKARKEVEELKKSHGVTMKFLSQRMSMSYNSFLQWKRSEYNLKEEKLGMIENIIECYK